jgi:hypothetical protein
MMMDTDGRWLFSSDWFPRLAMKTRACRAVNGRVRCLPVDEKGKVVNGSVKSAGKRNEESATVGCFVSDEQRHDD